jgi:hypothetical protein
MAASRYDSKGKLRENCTVDTQLGRFEDAMAFQADVVVLMARYPLILSGKWFDNQEGGKESHDFIEIRNQQGEVDPETAISTGVQSFLNEDVHVILVYPWAEVGWNVAKQLNANRPSDFWKVETYLKQHPLTTSYDVYLERSRSSFAVFDGIQHDNIYRVYPHRLVCDTRIKGRCVTHDTENLYYEDDDHPSFKGAEMINDLILDKIKEIERKSTIKRQ